MKLVFLPYPLYHIGSAGGYGKATGKANTFIYQWTLDCLLYFLLADGTLFSHRFPLFTLLEIFDFQRNLPYHSICPVKNAISNLFLGSFTFPGYY